LIRKRKVRYPKQAETLEIPLLIQETAGEKEKELEDLKEAMYRAKKQYGVEGVIAGALASTYQRDRVEKIAEEIGLKVLHLYGRKIRKDTCTG